MVDKIDRPEAPPPYFITRPKDAKESQHQQSEGSEEQEQRYKKELEEKEWKRFDGRPIVIKHVRVAREQINRCLFRAVHPRGGTSILQLDVVWKDGRTTHGALVLVPRMEDSMRLRKLSVGQEVPEEFWVRGQTVDFGIPQAAGESGSFNKEPGAARRGAAAGQAKRVADLLATLGISEKAGGRIRWGNIALYLFLLALAIVAIVAMI